MIEFAAFADGIELPACDIVNGPQLVRRIIKDPVSVTEYPIIAPGGDDIAHKQIVLLLNVRVGHHFAHQPARAACHEGDVEPRLINEGDGVIFIRRVGIAAPASVKDGCHLADDGDLHHEIAALFHQLTSEGLGADIGHHFSLACQPNPGG